MKAFTSIVLTVALLTAITSCANKQKEVEGEKITKVKVLDVTLQKVAQESSFSATVEPFKRNYIATASPNRIRSIKVEVGDVVRKGEVLVEMDPANLAQQRVQLENTKRDYDRLVELLNVGGASQQQVDQAKTQLESLKEGVRLLAENATLTAPIDGVVTARGYDNGDMTGQSPILTIMQIKPVKVLINISEQYFTSVKKGMPAAVTTDLYKSEVFPGKTSLIYPTIDPASRSFAVEITVPNGNGKLRPGMFARVNMNFGQADHIVVPDRAVIKQAGSNLRYVFVAKDGVAKYTPVELGRRLDDKYEILSGLQPGDKVVISGQARLIDNSKIEIQK